MLREAATLALGWLQPTSTVALLLSTALVLLVAGCRGCLVRERLRSWLMCMLDRRPLSVNYHFTRGCNYQCRFCFHTDTTTDLLPLKDMKRGLRGLAAAGLGKVNFSGGEPFLPQRGELLGQLVRFCKEQLVVEPPPGRPLWRWLWRQIRPAGPPSVSIVTNGSLVTEEWMKKYGRYVDILAMSCDSFDPDTNLRIGRHRRSGGNGGGMDQADVLFRVADLCKDYGVAFKLNTVVNRFNFKEDMSEALGRLGPQLTRWKVFQCLLIEGENTGAGVERKAEELVVSDADFDAFVARHARFSPVPENNTDMRNSYLILDEGMRFLNNKDGRKKPTASILEVGGVEAALDEAGFDTAAYLRRGGEYDWTGGRQTHPSVSSDIEDLVR